MESGSDNVNIDNPSNLRRDGREDNEPKVTNAGFSPGRKGGADDLFDDTVVRNDEGKPEAISRAGEGDGDAEGPTHGPAGASIREERVFDLHRETVREPTVEWEGESTSHRDPLSGESGTHPVAVGVGAVAGGMAVGAAAGLAAGAVGGPLGAAVGTAAGAVIGAFAGGYAGKGIGEAVNPTTEDHYWRSAYRTRWYVRPGSRYEEYEPAYEYGIRMRERLIDQSWDESEAVIRTGWEESENGLLMDWERARPAVRDAWDRLTPEPVEPPVSDEEKMRDE